MEPKFSLLLGLFILFSKVWVAPPEFVRGIKSLKCTEGGHQPQPAWHPGPWRSSFYSHGHIWVGDEGLSHLQDPILRRWGFWDKKTYFSTFLYTSTTAFSLTIKQESCLSYSVINNNTFFTDRESSFWNILLCFLLILKFIFLNLYLW